MSQSILIIGPSANGSLESSYGRAFKSLGCQVRFWDPEVALRGSSRGRKLGQVFSSFVHVEPWVRKSNVDLIEVADEFKPDLVLIVATYLVRCGTLAQLKVCLPNCLIYCVYPDSPHNLDSDRIHCLPFCDRVTTSSPAWVDAFKKLGASVVEYLPFAVDAELHSPAHSSTNAAFAHDVSFIGTWRPEREVLLEQLAEFDLCVWGSRYWKDRTRPASPLRKCWGGRPIFGQEFAQVCGQSKILLNIMDRITWPGPNMRTFEQAGCGAFSLVTRSAPVLELFKEGQTIECFESVEEARDKVSYYLSHEDERKRIASDAHKFVTEEGHTYYDRALTLLNWMKADRSH